MSHVDELDEYDAELELRLKREYNDVFPLFRYCVLTQEATYLCNTVERRIDTWAPDMITPSDDSAVRLTVPTPTNVRS